MKKLFGVNIKHIIIGLICILVLIYVGVTINQRLMDKWQPGGSIVGIWSGLGETREFGELEHIEVTISIDEKGIVTGTIGDAFIEECTIDLNRNDFERLLRIKTDYIIHEGYINGKITSNDELTYRNISIPFNIEEDVLGGTIFTVEGLTYPDPLILHLELMK